MCRNWVCGGDEDDGRDIERDEAKCLASKTQEWDFFGDFGNSSFVDGKPRKRNEIRVEYSK